MSFIQGTRVRLSCTFTDRATGAPTDVTEAVLTVEDPAGVLSQFTLSAGQVKHDDGDTGVYYFILDTSSAFGTWTYQFESTGNEATLGKKDITVRPRIGAAPVGP